MNQDQWTAVDNYINSLVVPSDPALDAAIEASTKAELPAIAVAPNQGKLLHILARLVNARKILEIGTLGGYSTIWLARALPADGHLISLELDPKHAEIARANLDRAGVKNAEIRLGRAADTLQQLVSENAGPFDLIFIDADKPGYSDYLQWSLKLSRRGTLIIADNVVRNGGVADPANTDANVLGIRRFNEVLSAEKRVTSTAIQTVGSKGYDGLAFILVTQD